MGENLRNRALLYYISKGLSPQAAAGLVGTLMSESSLSPDSVNTSSGAYGLAQWLGPRKRELFRRYGNKPTFENQLDYTWYEMNNTHKNALKYLNAAQTPEDAAKAAFGYYAFMTGPEGAIKEMEKYGLNGKASLAQKIKYANDVYNWAKGNTFVVRPRSEKYLNPNGKVEKTYIADTLPELVVTGNSPKLTLPSISLSLELAMAKLLLSASGFNPDMPMWELYTPSYRPLVMPQHYEGGKEGILATIAGGLKGRKLDPELEAATNEKMFNEPRNKNDLSKPLSPVDPVMKTALEYYTMTKGFKALDLFLLSRYIRGLGNTYRLLRRGNEDVENYTGRSMRRPNIQYADKEARRLGPTYSNSDSPVGFLYDTFLDPLVRGYSKLQLNKLLNILLP